MSDNTEEQRDVIYTAIWEEVAEEDNPFTARECYCSGYDVYGELINKAGWIEYLYLLFRQERPSKQDVLVLETLAIALANPGPRDYSVRAAMNASVGGAPAGASLMAAVSAGAGQYGGAHEVFLAMESLTLSGRDVSALASVLQEQMETTGEDDTIWPRPQHPVGFCPFDARSPTPVLKTLQRLVSINEDGLAGWLVENRQEIEEAVGHPLSMVGVSAATFIDLGMEPLQGEMLYLLLRLPGAAAHSVEQYMQWKRFPFFMDGIELIDVEESE